MTVRQPTPALGGPVHFLGTDRAILALLLILAIAVRFVTFGNPALGFDEQFYLLVGDRMLQGELPYVDIFDRKPIGIFLIYAGARLLGGEGFLQYKLVALVFVVATSWLIYALGRRRADRWGAGLAAALYILWLNFMEGEGGQTPVFYNLLVVGAAALLFGALRARERLWLYGCAAMLLLGAAIQIKYTVVFEGAFFGCAFLWLAWKQRRPWHHIASFAVAMVAVALTPTLLALLYYWSVGHAEEFIFCNFVSIFGQGKGAPLAQVAKLFEVSAILLPFGIIAFFGRRAIRLDLQSEEARLLRLWLIAAAFGVLIYWRFNSPHYAIPILPPLCLLLVPALDAKRRLGIGIALVALVAGQAVQLHLIAIKGGNDAMRAVAAAAKPNKGCIFVYNGYPGLYMMTGSCMPSRWSFPGHVNAQDENNAWALGVDPLQETKAILDRRPDAIVETFPAFGGGNRPTRALLHRVLKAHYTPVLCVPNARNRTRVVYRRKEEAWPRRIEQCPAEVFRDITE